MATDKNKLLKRMRKRDPYFTLFRFYSSNDVDHNASRKSQIENSNQETPLANPALSDDKWQ